MTTLLMHKEIQTLAAWLCKMVCALLRHCTIESPPAAGVGHVVKGKRCINALPWL